MPSNTTFAKALIVMALLEGISLLSFVYPAISLPLLLVAAVATFFMSLRKLEWGIYILFGELFLGSRGHLLEHGFLSLRLVVFLAVFVAWIVSRIKNQESRIKELQTVIHNSKFIILYALLLLVIGLGVVNGYFRGSGLANIFNDANGYLYLAILPAVLAGIRTQEAVAKLFKILGAGVVIIAVKTLILFVWFTYGLGGVATLYHWVLDQDIGEITGVVGSASRIFMQSQFYALVGLFVFGLLTLPLPLPSGGGDEEEDSSPLVGEVGWGGKWLVVAAAIFSVIMSLSRSFWLGGIVGAVFAAAMLLFYFRVSWKRFAKFAAVLILIAGAEVSIFVAVSKTAGQSETVGSRLENPVSEAAGGARLLLLPELLEQIKQSPIVGKGFGREVTYSSYLPDRVTADNPEGKITSFAFEWGYLDTILKIGLAGTLVYLLFIAKVFGDGWSKFQVPGFKFQILGLLSGLVALVILNITTPYLNHPLGIGYLMLSLVAFKNYE
ncbi:MAG: O-antigen ligase family protein [Candidatus Doudnabacteria bacterium]|nr:O-antigen ligase family protein [Candidatus Doudnabacteria bacterium]